jgi:hypothetical protein
VAKQQNNRERDKKPVYLLVVTHKKQLHINKIRGKWAPSIATSWLSRTAGRKVQEFFVATGRLGS